MSLKLTNLTKRFGDKCIFQDINYEFSDTGVYHIAGISGAGKTTLLNLITGIDKNYDGEILGGGHKHISYAFQEHRLFDTASALENALVSYQRPTEHEIARAKELFVRLGFAEKDMHLKAKQLSGGMKQRTSIIRALMKNASIYIFDEPTKELNAEIVSEFYKIIDELGEKSLVLLVSHEHVPDKYTKVDFFANNTN